MKNLQSLILILFLILTGCAPNKGDIYEHKLTKERIEIEDTGIGADLRDFYDSMSKLSDELFEENTALRIKISRWPIIQDKDMTKRCVVYEKKTILYSGENKVIVIDGKEYHSVPITYAMIISFDDLEADYVKVH